MSDSTLKLQRLMKVGTLNVRGDADNDDFKAAMQKAIGTALPLTPNTIAMADCVAYWLGPNEWMLSGEEAMLSELADSLRIDLAQQHASINDLSGGTVSYRLTGEEAGDLLSKGCTLDLHPSVFGFGSCAQTGLAKAGVVLCPLSDESGFDIVVRRSFADYLWQWLLRAGREYRIEVA